MLFLYIFGDNVEHTLGSIPFLVFYLIAGVVASFAQIFVDPESLIPTLGASGAIAGVLGAYIVLFPSNRVLVYFFYSAVWVPAIIVLGLWFLIQLVKRIGQIAVSQQASGGVAYLAHVGGFVTGLVVGLRCPRDARVAATGASGSARLPGLLAGHPLRHRRPRGQSHSPPRPATRFGARPRAPGAHADR